MWLIPFCRIVRRFVAQRYEFLFTVAKRIGTYRARIGCRNSFRFCFRPNPRCIKAFHAPFSRIRIAEVANRTTLFFAATSVRTFAGNENTTETMRAKEGGFSGWKAKMPMRNGSVAWADTTRAILVAPSCADPLLFSFFILIFAKINFGPDWLLPAG